MSFPHLQQMRFSRAFTGSLTKPTCYQLQTPLAESVGAHKGLCLPPELSPPVLLPRGGAVLDVRLAPILSCSVYSCAHLGGQKDCYKQV